MSQEISLPKCIGLIIDGNRRWAKNKGLATLEGHRKGAEILVDTARLVRDRGIKHMVVYAFSTENWNRSEEEVSYLMDLIKEQVTKQLSELGKENIRIRVIGQRDRLSPDVIAAIEKSEKESEGMDGMTLWVCLSYGGRAEILEAVKAVSEEGGEVTEDNFKKYFWSAEMPDPDIIIRTGGEKRLSNFLLWQVAYAELFFVDTMWPDFSEKILDEILEEYSERDRRHGK